METLPANVTAESDSYGLQSAPYTVPRPSFGIGSFKFGTGEPTASGDTVSAARDQAELEAACHDEQRIGDSNSSETLQSSKMDPTDQTAQVNLADNPGSIHVAHVGEVPALNPVIAKLRPSAQQKALKSHATLSFRQKLADKAFQMGSGTTNNEKSFLKTLVDKLAAIGLKPPTVMLEYDRVNVEADALVGSANIPSLSNVFVGTMKVSKA